MGIPREMREAWAEKRRYFFIPSPSEEQKILDSNTCIKEGIREGLKSASVTCVAFAVPTLIAVRVVPWAKANLNYTAQALIVSGATIAAFFIAADKTMLELARRNSVVSFANFEKRE